VLLVEPADRVRWRQIAAPAALLWVAAVPAACWFGHPIAWHRMANVAIDGWFGGVTLVAGLVAAGVAATVLAEVVAGGVRRLWLGYFVPRPLSFLLLRWRQWRWVRADDRSQTAATGSARKRAEQRRNRIALSPPESPTWTGDRVAALQSRVRNEYGLDLPSAWSRLWLLVPESARVDLREARQGYLGASRWMAWAVIYGVTAVIWWPFAGMAVVASIVAIQSGRAAAATTTDLAEAIVDLHAVSLARELGVEVTHGRLEPSDGQRVNRRTRKGA